MTVLLDTAVFLHHVRTILLFIMYRQYGVNYCCSSLHNIIAQHAWHLAHAQHSISDMHSQQHLPGDIAQLFVDSGYDR